MPPRLLYVPNWDQYQKFKYRNPDWIKLHVSLLDSYEFSQLEDFEKYQVIALWLYASKKDGCVPHDEKYLRIKINTDTQIKLKY